MTSRPKNWGTRTLSMFLTYPVYYWSKQVIALYMRRATSIVKVAYMHLLSDVSPDSSLTDFKYLSYRVESEGISFLTKTLPLLGKALESGIENGLLTIPTNFCAEKGSKCPRFLGSLFARIFNEDGRLCNSPSADAVRAIRQICYYAYKADFPRKPDQDVQFLQNFINTEREIKSLEIQDDPLLRVSRLVTSAVFSGYDREKVLPFNGPGASSTASIYDKDEKRLAPNLPVYEHFGRDFFFSPNDAMDRLGRFPVSSTFDLFRSNVSAEIVLINKDSRGPRVISKEPYEHMYIQQGIRKYLERCIYRHDVSSGHVNFDDQTVNQRLSEASSITKEYATLDLKDASDRVSLRLVECLFGGSPELLKDMLSCRSQVTKLPDGRLLALAKFAPMGSALCFPVLSWVCYILIVSSLIGKGLELAEAKARVYVFGDDIIVSSEFAEYATAVLERYGLKVNTGKSFTKGHFRESCGADFYNGIDVTPVRLRRLFEEIDHGNRRSVKRAANYVSHANSLFSKGLFNTSEYFYTLAEQVLGPLPYGLPTSPYLCRMCSRFELVPLQQWYISKNGYSGKFKAYVRSPIKRIVRSTVWGHLLRCHRQWGSGKPLPLQGVYSEPRNWKVTRKSFNMDDVQRQLYVNTI